MEKQDIPGGLAFPMHNQSLSIDQTYWGTCMLPEKAGENLPR